MNALQEEIANAIEGSGGVLNPASNAQLLAAIQALAQTQGDARYAALTAFAKSLTTSGYQKLPSGLIIQWGISTTAASGAVAVTFPITFPTACYIVTTGLNNPSNNTTGATSNTVSGFTANAAIAATGAGVSANIMWIAIGS